MNSYMRTLVILFILMGGFLTGCSWLEKDETILSVTSPDGNMVACVTKFTPCIDGPCQKLWLKKGGDRKSVMLEKLCDDSRWCDEIQWTPNGQMVAFLIMRKYLYIYDVSGSMLFKSVDLVPGTRDYPPNPWATDFSFNADSKKVRFTETEFELVFDLKKDRFIRANPKVEIREIDIEEKTDTEIGPI
ncbi:MAG: hypothetical protein OEY18_02860 [Candidatus Aminicenantes bacterium]|nr:hypothetical protein [Candidatus Aminicenantes bacterium]MDH5383625.1 hypothetical protein [Candidatus Aminicenantes bacterium]